LYSLNSFVEAEFFKIARDALSALSHTLINKIGGKIKECCLQLSEAFSAMRGLKDSITLLPEFEALLKPLMGEQNWGIRFDVQEVVDKVQLVINGFEIDDKDIKGFKNSQDIFDFINTIKKNYSKRIYILSKRGFAKEF